VLLDSGPLGHACRRRGTRLGDECREWLDDLLARGVDIIVLEIADYEVRRELLRIGASGSLFRLDSLVPTGQMTFVPITTAEWRQAAVFLGRCPPVWHSHGVPRCSRRRRDSGSMRSHNRAAGRPDRRRHSECWSSRPLLRRSLMDDHCLSDPFLFRPAKKALLLRAAHRRCVGLSSGRQSSRIQAGTATSSREKNGAYRAEFRRFIRQ
jgi:hypothetical protein